ncbi:MAG: MoaD/ThiS family protein [Acidimicrobiales bacterium]
MARLRLFGPAREAARVAGDQVPGDTVGEVLDSAAARYGSGFTALLPACQVWVNGEPADRLCPVDDHDEVGVLPPFSGG